MLLAMDIDGTSVGRDHRLGEKTRQALRRFRQAGHVVCFASGRNEFDMWNMCGDHREADYVICNTGGKILRAADDAVLSLHLADAESVRALAGACLGHNDCVLYVIAAGYMGVSRMTPGVREYTDSIRCRPAVYASAEELPLRGLHGKELEDAIRQGILHKPERHHLAERRSDTPRNMNQIGG